MTNLQKLGIYILALEILGLAVIHGVISEKVAAIFLVVMVIIAAFSLSRDDDELEI